MLKMLSLPEPCQPKNLPVPFAVFGSICLLVLALPTGGSANSYSDSAELTAAVSAVVEANIEGSSDTNLVATTAVPATPSVRPTSLISKERHLRILKRQGHLPAFVSNDSVAMMETAHSDDRRLQRKGRTWKLSDSFTAQVGSDPWALSGVGFPNIETHDNRVDSRYKTYKALVDWKLVNASNDQWEPIPAVYCMGLSSQQIADRAAKYEREILSYSIQYGISASLIKAVITKESCFDTKAVSKVGAEGLMQLMPETARWLKVTDSNNASQNLSAGIRYLSDLRKRFGTEELALAAYNAGPGNVERHGGIPPFEETQDYVKSVMAIYKRYTATTRFANQRVSN